MENEKPKIKSFTDLNAWKEGHKLVLMIYKITDNFPQKEVFGLTSQMRRSAVSVPSNIAEGYKRRNLGEYIQFLRIADASAAELETQIIISKKIQEIKNLDYLKVGGLLEETQKMLSVIISKLIAKR